MLGLTKTMIIVVIAFGSLWPTLLATIQGIKSVEPRLFEMAQTIELSRREVITTIVLPSALPDIFAGARLGLTVSLILAVVTEMMSAEPGLGSIILQAARSFNSADLFAGVIVLGGWGSSSTRSRKKYSDGLCLGRIIRSPTRRDPTPALLERPPPIAALPTELRG